MVNEVNYPTAGRNFETLGEDPYLAGQLAAGEVTGVQAEGLIAELKHYIENDFENGRTSTSVEIDDQTLHETELQAFETGINAGAGVGHVLLQPDQRRLRLRQQHHRQDVLREQLASAASCSPTGARCTRPPTWSTATTSSSRQRRGHSNFSVAALTADVTNGTPAVAATADFPAYPAITGAQWKQRARQRRVPDPHRR